MLPRVCTQDRDWNWLSQLCARSRRRAEALHTLPVTSRRSTKHHLNHRTCGKWSLTLLNVSAKMINYTLERACEQLKTDGPPRLASRRAGCPTEEESNMRQHTHAQVAS